MLRRFDNAQSTLVRTLPSQQSISFLEGYASIPAPTVLSQAPNTQIGRRGIGRSGLRPLKLYSDRLIRNLNFREWGKMKRKKRIAIAA